MHIYLVGGAVRDQLLAYPFNERDWVVVGATPEQMQALHYRPVGKDFPVFIHPKSGEEYALARTERKTAPGYTGFLFHADPSVTLEDDLIRRDLTINAIAQTIDGKIIDPYGGMKDIQEKQLRHVSPAFSEDPVRVLRVARFMARYYHLGFQIAAETMALMQAMVQQQETQHLVAERVWQETSKALSEKNPEQFFRVLKQAGALHDIFPELDNPQWDQQLQQLCLAARFSAEPELRFASLCYSLDADTINTLCHRVGTPTRFRDLTLLLHRYKQSLTQTNTLSAEAITQLLQTADALRKPERFEQMLELSGRLSEDTDYTQLLDFWHGALHHFTHVDVQVLVQQGYTKAALGDAIFQTRLLQVREFLHTYDPNH